MISAKPPSSITTLVRKLCPIRDGSILWHGRGSLVGIPNTENPWRTSGTEVSQRHTSNWGWSEHYLSIKARNLCLSVCVCLKYLCRSGSDWPEIFNMAAAWFEGVQCRICLDYNYTVNKWFHKWFTNSASTVNHSIVTGAPEPPSLQSSPHDAPWETSRFIPAAARAGPGFWSRSVHLNWLL